MPSLLPVHAGWHYFLHSAYGSAPLFRNLSLSLSPKVPIAQRQSRTCYESCPDEKTPSGTNLNTTTSLQDSKCRETKHTFLFRLASSHQQAQPSFCSRFASLRGSLDDSGGRWIIITICGGKIPQRVRHCASFHWVGFLLSGHLGTRSLLCKTY